jgi:hypothetical protein
MMRGILLAGVAALGFAVPASAMEYSFEGFTVQVALSKGAAAAAAKAPFTVAVAWVGELKTPRTDSEDQSLALAQEEHTLDAAVGTVSVYGGDVPGADYVKVKEDTIEVTVAVWSESDTNVICDGFNAKLAAFDASKPVAVSCKLQSEP